MFELSGFMVFPPDSALLLKKQTKAKKKTPKPGNFQTKQNLIVFRISSIYFIYILYLS